MALSEKSFATSFYLDDRSRMPRSRPEVSRLEEPPTRNRWAIRGSTSGTADFFEFTLGRRQPPREDAQINSALQYSEIERACARLRQFKQYPVDWDNEGAEKPLEDTLDAAISFLNRLQPWHPRPAATLDAHGRPVVEFKDEGTDFFAKIRFLEPDYIELFTIAPKGGAIAHTEGALGSEETLKFLSNEMQITLRP